MPRLEERDYTYLTTVRGMCRTCRALAPARVFIRCGSVWQQSLCPSCENEPAMIAKDSEWYLRETLQTFPDRSPLPGSHPPREGCPLDCGPCAWHASPCQLPVVSITNACELSCPVCFTYNRPDRAWYMPLDEMQKTVDWIVASSGKVDLINITGGEPTLHPQLLDILQCCRRPEIGRVTMNTNGLRLAEDEDLCRRLAELGVYVILSFSAFDPETSRRLHGRDVVDAKLKAIENLTRAGAKMTLLHVMMRDTNEDAASGIFDLMMANDNILSYTVQTMTYTGQGGGQWLARAHIPVDEAARIVCRHSKGALEFSDFLPRPSAHPLCYLTCTMLKAGATLLPFSRFAPREKLQSLCKNSYLIRLEDEESFIRETIDDLYARGERKHLRVFRALIDDLFPNGGELTVFDQQKRAEASVRTVYIHSHMDEDTFDCSRAMLCPDLVPAEPGRLIPACTYNLFYRMKDERFYVEP
ncbi:MAG: radical SAM protein [Candidatus Sumerlaeota bacterium]|nr:radical SAM protein [Candidatus Sumerlaeota bacterium]